MPEIVPGFKCPFCKTFNGIDFHTAEWGGAYYCKGCNREIKVKGYNPFEEWALNRLQIQKTADFLGKIGIIWLVLAAILSIVVAVKMGTTLLVKIIIGATAFALCFILFLILAQIIANKRDKDKRLF